MSTRDGDAQGADLAQQSDTLRYYLVADFGQGIAARPRHGLSPSRERRSRCRREGRDAGPAGSRARVCDSPQLPTARRARSSSRALALPIDQGLDSNSIWAALGLALRERQDPAPYIAAIREDKDENAEKVLEFITAARASANPADAEQLLDGLPLEWRGQAYSCRARDPGTARAGRMAPRCRPVAVRARAAVLQHALRIETLAKTPRTPRKNTAAEIALAPWRLGERYLQAGALLTFGTCFRIPARFYWRKA